ncbi:hypothetical protein R9C00_26545 [Flammeovirgaceae bacterium SG7u.111]|nr:hypothetical protein [Flammeovirgaceae bacterium SG7u.132]WPO35259.1 hypothetical protein R9C00_26545 [Flammeovirgaceae bacterium SG7u.111]
MLKLTSFTYPSDYLNKLRSVFYLMVGAPMGIFLILFMAAKKGSLEPQLPSLSPTLQIAIPIICGLGVSLTYLRYFKQLKKVRQSESLKQKFITFYGLKAQTFTLLVIFTLLSLLGYWLTAHVLFAGLYITLLVLFAMNNPSYHNVVGELKLNKEQREAFKTNQPIEG